MRTKPSEVVRFEILRVQTHFAVERIIEEAADKGFGADDAIEALEQALEALRSYRSTRARYPKTPRLF